MPGCAAVGCSNSARKGFLMKRFPKDEQRRKEWALRVKRYKWTPTDTSFLCEVHFPSEMWEKTREDGTRKLKLSAVPTLFPFINEKNEWEIPYPKPNVMPIKIEREETLIINKPSTYSTKLIKNEENAWNLQKLCKGSSDEAINNDDSDN